MIKSLICITTLCLLLCAIATSSHAEIETSTHDGCVWPVLKTGMRAPNVKALQYLLHSKGYKIITDGDFGPQTQNFVKQFQRAHKLRATGVVEAYTWEALVPLLHRGSHGDAVRAVQILLDWQFANWHPEPGKSKPRQIRIDGDYGAVTEQAVKFFQRAMYWIPVTGTTNHITWACVLGGSQDGE